MVMMQHWSAPNLVVQVHSNMTAQTCLCIHIKCFSNSTDAKSSHGVHGYMHAGMQEFNHGIDWARMDKQIKTTRTSN
jgi:hypothetical protein